MKYLSLLAAALSLSGAAAQASPVQWTTASGGNGHFYELVSTFVTWTQARDAAAARTHQGMTGYLATITSAAEQAFLDAIVAAAVNPWGSQTDHGAWLGGSDAATEGVWQWVTEPGGPIAFTYANWATSPLTEPNNEPDATGTGEDYAQGWRFQGNRWNDNPSGFNYAYMVEYSPAAVPVPAALPMLVLGIGGLVALRKGKRGRKTA